MKPHSTLLHLLALAGSSLLAISSASAQSTHIWNNSNVSNTPNTFDWLSGGPNTQGSWTGGTPVSSNLNTIQFFPNTTTAVPNSANVTQGSNLNNGGTAFQLGTLTLNGLASNSPNIDLTMNVTGDALNFSAATGTINLNTLDVAGNGRNIVWNVSNNIQLGTSSSSSVLTITGSGGSAFNFSGSFSELQSGGGSKLVKSGGSTTTLSGVVTVSGGLEVNGGLLRLTNANNAITGGFFLNGGTLGENNNVITTATLDDNLITVNGSASLGMANGTTTNGGITLTSGSLTTGTNGGGATINGAVTGAGSISIGQLGGGSHTLNLNSTANTNGANTFTGNISFTGSTHALAISVNSLADTASPGTGNIRFVSSGSTHTFSLGSGAIAPLTLTNRRIELVSGSNATYTLANNSTQAFTINSDLLVGISGGNRTLTLAGTGSGLSTFGGVLANGTLTNLGIAKNDTGTWILSGANSYSGATAINAGILVFANKAAKSASSTATALAAGTVGLGVKASDVAYYSAADVGDLFNTSLTGFSLNAASGVAIDTTNAGGSFDQTVALTAGRALTKLGTGTLILSQANSYTGATAVRAGVLNIRDNASLGTAAGGVTVSNGAALEIQGGITVGAEALSIRGTGISNGGALRNISGTNVYGGAVTLAGDTLINSVADSLNLSGVVSGTAALTKVGAGTLTLSGAASNTYSGLTTVDAGLLELGKSGTTNAIANGGLTINGGTVRYTGASTNMMGIGAININDTGTLDIQGISDSVGAITIAKGGQITGTTGLLTTTGLVSNGGGTISGFSSGGLSLTDEAGITYNGGVGSTTLTINRFTVSDSTTNHQFNIANGEADVDTEITQVINNTGSNVTKTITKTGAGVLQFSGSTTGAAGSNVIQLVINDGSVLLNKADNIAFVPASGAITVGDNSGTANSAILRYATTGGNNQINDPAITINSDGLFDLNGKNETTSGAMTNRGSITTGVGTLTLSNTTATALTMGGTGSINGNISLTGTNGAGITATGNTTIAGTLTLGGNTRAIAVTNASDILTISASTTGTGVLTKSGAGTLLLTAASALPQHTTAARVVINGGTLGVRVGGAGWTTTEVNTLLTNATKTSGALGIDTTNDNLIQWTAFTATNLGANLGLTKLGTNTLTLDQANTYNGTTSVLQGVLNTTQATALAGYTTAARVVVNGGTLGVQVGGSGWTTGEVDTLLSNATKTSGALGIDTTNGSLTQWTAFTTTNLGANLGLTKLGTNSLTLDLTNTYTGATTVSAGKLIINGNISTSSLTTVDVGATLGGSGTVGKTIVNGTLAVGNSPGAMVFTDALTLAGITITEIDGTAGPGVLLGGHDFVNLTGSGAAGVLTYGGTMTLDIGTVFGAGSYTWNLFDMDSETGTFTSITLADQYFGSLLDADLNGVWDLTSGSNTWQFSELTGVLGLTVVPETSTSLLGALGALVMLRRRRR